MKNNSKSDSYDFLKKITKTTPVCDYEVLTDTGWSDIKNLHETIPYDVYLLKLSSGLVLKCADNHIVFDENFNEIFVKDLNIGDLIMVIDGQTDVVINVENLGYEEIMYDLELPETSNHRYYTNNILSHNTHLAKQLAKELFGSKDNLIRFDMSEFQERHTASRLFGATPSYIGYEEGGELTEKVKNKPYSIILFDEIEKAHKDIFNTLLQILDDGRMTDGQGKTVNFKNCVIIMTSNVGLRKVQDFGNGIGFGSDGLSAEKKKITINKELKKLFPPEFLNRVDDIITFNTLNETDVEKISKIELNTVLNRIKELNYNITFDDLIIKMITKAGFDDQYGARPLKRVIQDKIENFISVEILKNRIVKNKEYKLSIDNDIIFIKE